MQRRVRLNLLLLVAVVVAGWLVWHDLNSPLPPVVVERVTDLDPQRVSRLVIEGGTDGREVEFLREQGRWWLQREPRLPADALRVNEVLRLVDARSESSYALAEVDPVELGLDPPRARVRVDHVELRIGAQEPLRYRRYVANGDRVYLVADTAYVHLGADWVAFVDPAPLAGMPRPRSVTNTDRNAGQELPGEQVAAWRELSVDGVHADVAPEGEITTLAFRFADETVREMRAWRAASTWRFAWRDGVVSYVVSAERGPELGLE